MTSHSDSEEERLLGPKWRPRRQPDEYFYDLPRINSIPPIYISPQPVTVSSSSGSAPAQSHRQSEATKPATDKKDLQPSGEEDTTTDKKDSQSAATGEPAGDKKDDEPVGTGGTTTDKQDLQPVGTEDTTSDKQGLQSADAGDTTTTDKKDLQPAATGEPAEDKQDLLSVGTGEFTLASRPRYPTTITFGLGQYGLAIVNHLGGTLLAFDKNLQNNIRAWYDIKGKIDLPFAIQTKTKPLLGTKSQRKTFTSFAGAELSFGVFEVRGMTIIVAKATHGSDWRGGKAHFITPKSTNGNETKWEVWLNDDDWEGGPLLSVDVKSRIEPEDGSLDLEKLTL